VESMPGPGYLKVLNFGSGFCRNRDKKQTMIDLREISTDWVKNQLCGFQDCGLRWRVPERGGGGGGHPPVSACVGGSADHCTRPPNIPLSSHTRLQKGNYRDLKKSPLFLVLQTPSKCFKNCSLPRVLRGGLWEVKSMSEIFKSSYGGKFFLRICKFENGLRANRYEWMNTYS
jgi:hypothetical protein